MNATWKWPVMVLMGLAVVAVVWSFAQAAEDSGPVAAVTPVVAFSYELPKAGLTSAGVFDADGNLVRTLWRMTDQAAGKYEAVWGGMTDMEEPAPAGKYEIRVVLNNGTYKNVGIIGNTGTPPNEMGHIQGRAIDLCVDDDGRIYTANGWDEAGHDFKVFNPDGTTAFHARFQIRNGNPNAGAYSIAIDDGFIYCGTEGWYPERDSRQQIRRFTVDKGAEAKFTDEEWAKRFNGHIERYDLPMKHLPELASPEDKALMLSPLKALAVRGDDLLCTDTLAGKILWFHKVTGKKVGEFNVKLPHALAVDAKGQVWVGHERSKVSVFSAEGKRLATPITDAKHVKALKFGPDNKLVLTDSEARQVRIYDTDPAKATVKLAKTFGVPAKPGDYDPKLFYTLECAALDGEGNLITSQTLLTAGCRITKFAPDGKVLWDHLGMEFCTVGGYGQHRPDEMITQLMHRIALDRKTNTWAYRGTVIASDPNFAARNRSGAPRVTKIGEHEFYFQCYGDSMQAYRRGEDGLFRLAAMVGGIDPLPDGTWSHRLPGPQRIQVMPLWSWSDTEGDGVLKPEKITKHKELAKKGHYTVFGLNADADGNILFCNHHTGGIHELPRTGLDKRGNPTYDWNEEKILVKRDESPAKFFPLMAVRSEDGSMYALGRAEEGSVFPRATREIDGWVWMGGELLAKYNKDGQREWIIRMPHKCNGLDVIPGGGVVTGFFEKGEIYHVTADGLVIGSVKPGEAAGNMTGWLDNTAAIAANRGPDGVIDVFAEDSFLHRFLWHRIDDKDIQTIKVPVERK